MGEIANISRIRNSTRIARLRYLQISVKQNFLVNHFFAKIAKKIGQPICATAFNPGHISWVGEVNARELAPVVQRVDNANQWMAQLVSLTLIRLIVIYPGDSAIQRLIN